MMIDYSDFQAAKDSTWYRVEGTTNDPDNPLTGMSAVTDALQAYILAQKGLKVQTKSPVVGMAQNADNSITVTYGETVSSQQAKTYDLVISTTSLGCLQRMDLSGLNLTREVLTGIRSLAYDRATKVAIKCAQTPRA
jgi:protoporphyrinogen oxidase